MLAKFVAVVKLIEFLSLVLQTTIATMSGQPAAPPSVEDMWQIILQQKQEIAEGRKEIQRGKLELASFREYMEEKMVPLEEVVFAPKRMSKRDRDAEVERATKAFRNAGDKRTVGFLADLRIDVQERQEALQELNSCREEAEDGVLGDFKWKSPTFKDKFNATMEYLLEEAEAARRKLVELLDHYHIAKDSKWGWTAVDSIRLAAPSTMAGTLSLFMSSQSCCMRRRGRSSRRPRRMLTLQPKTNPLEGSVGVLGLGSPPASHPPLGTR